MSETTAWTPQPNKQPIDGKRWRIPAGVIGLRPVWMDVRANEFKNYSVLVCRDGGIGVDCVLRRLVTGQGVEESEGADRFFIDLLAEDEYTTLDQVPMTRRTFRRLVKKYKLRRERPLTLGDADV